MPKTSKKKIDSEITDFEKKLNKMSNDEIKELLLINTYKLALTRAQLDSVVEILIKKGITTYDEVWKKTNETFKENEKK
jgi:polyhydroxyalkanoate synthesis regulator phasin